MSARPTSPRLRPCIAELLRTRLRPCPLVLRLEKVSLQVLDYSGIEPVDRDEHDNTAEGEDHGRVDVYRLWLSDGQLMIQAVLEQPLHHLFQTEDCAPGSLLEVRRFQVRRGKRLNGASEVVYLAVADYRTVTSANPATSIRSDVLADEGGFIREEPPPGREKRRYSSPLDVSLLRQSPLTEMPSTPSSQESDGFETAMVDSETLDSRRLALHELSSNTQRSASRKSPHDETPIKRRKLLAEREKPAHPDKAVRSPDVDESGEADSTVPGRGLTQAGSDGSFTTQPLSISVQRLSTTGTVTSTSVSCSNLATAPLHTLSSLLQPPRELPVPSRNYACNIFAVVSWCSPNLIYPRHAQSPFPPKRHIKIHDPSIASRHAGVTIAVYDNARTFKPQVGTVALFRGVVMQRWEGEIILNAYARRVGHDADGNAGQGRRGERWWYVDDEESLVGMNYDVRGMRDWWADRSQGQEQSRADSSELK